MTSTFRDVCLRCRRPASVCWCGQLAPVASRTRACFLQHPLERRVAIGTARMAHLSLPNSELHEGVEFAGNARVRELAAQPGTMLLFPGEGSVDAAGLAGDPPRTLIVVDGTWALAAKLIKQNPFLAALPRLGFVPPRPSNYRIRREPADHFVSTIEAVAHVLGLLEGDPERFTPILRAFDWMVDQQLEHFDRRQGPPRKRLKRSPRPRVDGTVKELRARPQDVVAIYAEANTWPYGSELEGEAEVLQLVACRPASGERFEAVLAPRRPLAPNAPLHLEIPAERLLAGEPREQALARFAAFVRPADLTCGWGPYAVDLLRQERAPERPFSDLRLAAARRLRRRPGGVEQAVRLLGRPELPAPLGEGRAGRRLASLVALLELLCAREAPLAGQAPGGLE